jgi:Zn-dependent protease with chaperone function
VTWEGYYYDGKTAARESVTLTLEGARLRIRRSDGSTLLWPLSLIRQTQGTLSTEQIRIELGDEALLVSDERFVAEIRAASPAARRTFRRQWKTYQVLSWSAGALVVVAALYIWGGAAAATWVANRLPPSWDISMGRSFASYLSRTDRVCADADSVPELASVVDRLVDAGGRTPYEFHVYILRDTIVNAFAVPGGFLFLNAGLIDAARTPEELAGVLAHEIQHVTLRHSTRAILRELPLRVALASISGAGIESGATTMVSLGALSYRRADEAEADREGMRLLHAANVDASGMISFMRTLDEKNGGPPEFARYLSSHPHTADRIAGLEAMAMRESTAPRPLLDPQAWNRLRSICGR